MTVDTQLWAKGLPIVGNFLGLGDILNNNVGGSLPSPKEIAWRMTASALKDSIKDMYEGEVTVIGDASIKPYDRVMINDIYERINGQFEVEAVVHSFNCQTGFTTSIYADCMSIVDDPVEKVSRNMLNNLIMPSVVSSTSLCVGLIAKKRYTGMSAVLGKLISSSADKGADLLAKATSYFGKDIDFATKLDHTKTGLKSLLKLDGAALGTKGIAILSGSILVEMAAEMAIEYCVSASISQSIYRYLKNLEVLHIYPLKRRGKVMVAGIDGHKGLVEGSPTENQQDEWTSFLSNLFDGEEDGSIHKSLINFFLQEERFSNVAKRLKADNNIAESSIDAEALKQSFVEDVAKIYTTKSKIKAISSLDRYKTEQLNNAEVLSKYLVQPNFKDVKTLNTDKISEALVPILEDTRIKGDLGKIPCKIIMYSDTSTEHIIKMKFAGKSISVVCYEDKGLWLIPALRDEAVHLLHTVILIANEILNTDKTVYVDMNNPILFIRYCTIIGGTNSWLGTGYGFTIQLDVNRFKEEDANYLIQKVKNFYVDNDIPDFFTAEIDNRSTTQINFVVRPTIENGDKDVEE